MKTALGKSHALLFTDKPSSSCHPCLTFTDPTARPGALRDASAAASAPISMGSPKGVPVPCTAT